MLLRWSGASFCQGGSEIVTDAVHRYVRARTDEESAVRTYTSTKTSSPENNIVLLKYGINLGIRLHQAVIPSESHTIVQNGV